MPHRGIRARLDVMSAPRVVHVLGLIALIASPWASDARAADAAEVRETAFRLLNEGVTAYGRGDFEDAEEKLGRAAGMELNNFRTYLYHGLALSGLRRYPEAITTLEIALELEPTHLQGLIALGDAHLAMGDVAEARAAYYRALKERPEYARALDGLARSYEASADLVRAAELYRRAIASDPGFAEAYTNLGELYLRQDRFREAVDLLTEAVSIRPDHAGGLNRLALAYGRLGLFNEAVASIERAIELEPNNPEHPATLGTIQVELGLLSRARESFREALRRDGGEPRALQGMAEIYRREGDYEEAIRRLDRALEDDRLRSWMRQDIEDRRTAVEAERDRLAALESAAARDDADPSTLRALAAIQAGRGRYGEAADLETRAAPDGPDDLARVGYFLLRADRHREALEAYERVVALEPGRGAWQLNRGVALAGLGRDEAALAAFRAAAADDDARAAARGRLYAANALLRLGRTADAATTYRAFLDATPDSEDAERVRRILARIAPDLLPEPPPDPARVSVPVNGDAGPGDAPPEDPS